MTLLSQDKAFALKEFLFSLLLMILLLVFPFFFSHLPLIRIRSRGGIVPAFLLAACFLLLFFLVSGLSLLPYVLLLVIVPSFLASELLARHVSLNYFILGYILFLLLMQASFHMYAPPFQWEWSGDQKGETGSQYGNPVENTISRFFPGMDEEQRVKTFESIHRIYPASVVILSIVAVLLNVLCIKKIPFFNAVPMNRDWCFNHLKIPDYFLFAFLFFGIFLLLKTAQMHAVALNGFIVTVFVYLFQGLAILRYFLTLFKAGFLLRMLAYASVFLFSLWIILAIAGLFDTWFNFRRYKIIDGKLTKE